MFVAFELQIGLKKEIEGLRKTHDAYEEGRILNAQPLLKMYKEVQEGNFADCKYQELGKKEIVGKGTDPMAPEKLCLNNKRLNIWANQGKA
eukprot:1540527-Ditylum_brightwellii.AAC.1